MNHYIFFDLETSTEAKTILSGIGEIIQIGAKAVTCDTLRVVEEFEIKVAFSEATADKWILDKVHYDQLTWLNEAFPMERAHAIFSDFVEKYAWFPQESGSRTYVNAIMGGHNVKAFDLPVLLDWEKRHLNLNAGKMQIKRISTSYSPTIDTLTMVQTLSFISGQWFPTYKLKDLCDYYGIELLNWHEALSDVQASIELAKVVRQNLRLVDQKTIDTD